ncbi:MAG: flagellar type III secretion system pore protein FliP [Phycisphaerales bacterium]|nr:flagellar type III secretion system pore protein FliP [Phycisphaerales bacterium]
MINVASMLAMTGIPLGPTSAEISNPVGFIEQASQAIPGLEGGVSGPISIVLLLTVLSLAPAILILCTCFTRFVVVLGLLRQALGTQGLPPTQVVVGLSLFLTFVAMAPTLEAMWDDGIKPYVDAPMGQRNSVAAWDGIKAPLREFMFAQIDRSDNWSSVEMILEFRGVDIEDRDDLTYADVDMVTLIPAFVLSELKIAFLIAFRIYLPFLVIDMIVSSLLISMGMMMLPPVFISLPFKLLLFVVADGWALVAGSLMDSVARIASG